MALKPLPVTNQDPHELVAMVIPGEPGQLEMMAQALIDEYILLGWSAKRLMTLFTNPFYLATHRIYQQKGERFVKEMIHSSCAQWGIKTGKE